MKKLIMILILLTFFGCNDLNPQIQINNQTNKSLLELHNQERNIPLKLDSQLSIEAQKWADKMARSNWVRHSNMNMILYKHKGENIAAGQFTSEEVMKDWISSQGHYENITSTDYTHVGFGKSINRKGKTFWCAMFGG